MKPSRRPGMEPAELAQAHRERAHAREFIRHWPPLAGAQLERGLRPDFIATLGTRRIGIEHTEIFRDTDPQRGSPARATESNEDRAARLASERYTG